MTIHAAVEASRSQAPANRRVISSNATASNSDASANAITGTRSAIAKRRTKKIPRPQGEAGRTSTQKKSGFSLLDEMDIDKDLYNDVRVS